MRRRNIILIVIVLLLIISGVVIRYLYTSPLYSLYKTKKAIEKRDYGMVLEYSNADSLINNFVDKISIKDLDSNDALESFETKLLSSIPYGLRPQMTLIIKKILKRSIEKGNLEHLSDNIDNVSKTDDNSGDTWELIKSIRIIDLEYVNITGNTSVVGLNCRSNSNGKKFLFRIRMRQAGDHWQIVELIDFPNLKKLMI